MIPKGSAEALEGQRRIAGKLLQEGKGICKVTRLVRQHRLPCMAGSRWTEFDLMFPTGVGTPDDPGNLRKDFLRTLERAGLPMIRFHDLRHTAASIMLNRGVPAIVVSKRLGHAKPSTTLDIYGHLYLESQDEPARIMDEILTPVLVTLPKPQGAEQPISGR